MSSAVQPNETERLKALASYQALDTPPEFQQDALTELAAEICRCPVALVSLVDERRQWFKSKYGLPAHFTELDTAHHVIVASEAARAFRAEYDDRRLDRHP